MKEEATLLCEIKQLSQEYKGMGDRRRLKATIVLKTHALLFQFAL